MEGTAAEVRISREVMRNANVPHLGMYQAVKNAAMDNRPSADACANG